MWQLSGTASSIQSRPSRDSRAMISEKSQRLVRLPLLFGAIACLLAGIWGGLVRLPLNLPLPGGNANWITFHGPLMVCGFLGTVIALERAVGLRAWWTYLAPLLTAAGGAWLLGGGLGSRPLTLMTLGSALFWAVTLKVVKLQRATFTLVMSAGALSWTVGNVLWWVGWPINRVVPWWIAFLALTILGERLDLSRFQKASRWSAPLLHTSLGLFAGALILQSFVEITGERILGAGVLALALWLGRFDLARRTVTRPGLPRFMALGLLTGYGWLGLAGVLMGLFSPLGSGLRYDAVLHSFFLGFVFAMIFAHAPVIFPAVLGVQPSFSKRFYAHLALLEAGLALRISGDLANSAVCRQWGAIVNALAIALFLLNTISALLLRPPAK